MTKIPGIKMIEGKMGFCKGGIITLGSDNSTVNMCHRMQDMPDVLILNNRKLPVATGWITMVSTCLSVNLVTRFEGTVH
ncbi:MAG: hypothetical protein ACT6FC_02835 [Methanosarcinaceae archaeon]